LRCSGLCGVGWMGGGVGGCVGACVYVFVCRCEGG